MESIYYVLCWHCHRRCKHCYESRFRPYIRDELEAVVAEAETNFPNIIANLPERMTFIEAKADDYVGWAGITCRVAAAFTLYPKRGSPR